VGIGPEDPSVNPFLRAELPGLRAALGGQIPTLRETEPEGPGGTAFPLDARLGIGGLPQSGTGQVALLTGAPAPVLLGQHFGPWVPVRLRPLLASENLLRRAQASGAHVVFANAYPRGWPGPLPTRKQAAPPLAALAAGVLSLHEEALAAGNAVAAEIVNDGWQRYRPQFTFPSVTPFEAGATLARIAAKADLTLFAHYHTDTIGHRGTMEEAVEALERVDRFLAGVLETPTSRPLVILGCSDHGNLEVVGEGHTLNPALGFTLRGHTGSDMQVRWMAHLSRARALNHVAPLIHQALTEGC
jgi:2,3-bisphosphoglycerate-independent phosphoglycerate mutase